MKKAKAAKAEIAVNDQPMKSDHDHDDWKAKDDARTLQSAGEILSDNERMKKAHGHHKKAKKAFKSIDDLISYRNDKYGAKAETDEV